MIKILYEDNHIIVAYKPKGILSQADGSAHIDMVNYLKNYVKEKYSKPGNVYIGLVHRLDMNTDGIMVFARTSKAAARISADIANHRFEKRYIAVVEGKLTGSKELINYLAKDEKNKKAYESQNGSKAELKYNVIKNDIIDGCNVSYVDVELKTGRFHQIRAQFSLLGHPIYGDKKYGSKHADRYYRLSAYKLGFYHPTLKTWLEFEEQNN